jgi:Transglycosylase-like domain
MIDNTRRLARGLPGTAIVITIAVAFGVMLLVVVAGVDALIRSATASKAAPVPTPTVTVVVETPVPGPTVTVTVTKKPKPAPTVTVTREPSAASRGRSGGNPSDEAFLRCVVKRESGGNPRAQNPTSSASGLFQFIDSTWRAYSREAGIGTQYSRAKYAPAAVQWELARWVVKNKGRYPWKPTVPGTAC